MALSGRINGTARSSSGVTSSYKYWCDWTATQNVEDNTSTISGTLSVQCIAFPNSAWSETTFPIVSVKVNGKTIVIPDDDIYHINTLNYRVSTFAKFSATVTHNADGTLSCPIVATFDMNDPDVSSLRSGSLSGYATLDTIPRASKIAATDANIGSTSTITVTRYSTSFTHTVTWECLGLSGTIATKSTSTVIPWSVPTAIYKKIPNARQATVTLKCTTFSGSVQIGDVQTATMRANIGSENAPRVSGSVVDINATTIALTGNKNSLIRYRSTAKCTVSATPKNSATIKVKTVNGITIPDSFVEIPGVETGTFRFSVTDSREFPASATVTKTLIPYIPLTINPIATRVSPTSNEIKLKFTGNFFKGSFGSLENTLTVKYRYRVYGTETWGEFTDIPLSSIDILDDGTYNSKEEISLGTFFDYQKSYDFEIRAQDGNGSTVLTSVSSQLQVSRGIPVFDWSNEDFHVRETLRTANVEPDGDVSVGTEQNPYAAGYFGQMYIGGKAAPIIEEERKSGNWYYRKWANGFCEMYLYISGNGSSTTQVGPFYQTSLEVDYPFTLLETYSITASGRTGGAGFVYPYDYTNRCLFYVWSTANSRSVTIKAVVYGRWK